MGVCAWYLRLLRACTYSPPPRLSRSPSLGRNVDQYLSILHPLAASHCRLLTRARLYGRCSFQSVPFVITPPFHTVPNKQDVEGEGFEEMCIRWMSVGAFWPFARNHYSDGNDNLHEPWMVGAVCLCVSVRMCTARTVRACLSLPRLFLSGATSMSERASPRILAFDHAVPCISCSHFPFLNLSHILFPLSPSNRPRSSRSHPRPPSRSATSCCPSTTLSSTTPTPVSPPTSSTPSSSTGPRTRRCVCVCECMRHRA